MNRSNTPNIGAELSEKSIDFIPEAHCYLKIDQKSVDLTTSESNFEIIEKDIIQEKEIGPDQIAEFKVNYHREFLKVWLIENNSEFDFNKIWRIREKCIEYPTQ